MPSSSKKKSRRQRSQPSSPFTYCCRICSAQYPSLTAFNEHRATHMPWRKKEDEDGEGNSEIESHFAQMTLGSSFEYEDSDDDDELYFGQLDKRDDNDDDDEDSYEVEGTEVWFTHESLADTCRSRADSALDFFNKLNGGKRYGFIEHGPNMSSNFVTEHINFKAKEKGRRDAPVETFFAQIGFRPGRRVECCVSLGPSALLPHWRKANLGGCKLCNGIIHHPTSAVENLRLE